MCDERERLITQIKPPRKSDTPKDCSSATQHFGPFPIGALVRIKVGLGDAWFCAQGSKSAIVARTNGAFIAAGTFDDYEVLTAEDRFISVIKDTDATDCYATVWETNRVMTDLEPT